jgi:hypothetical protein
LKFDRFEWFGDEVDASAGGVGEVAAGLFEALLPFPWVGFHDRPSRAVK